MSLMSKSCAYGLRAMMYLAGRNDPGYVSIRQMSDELDISFHFLTKVLQHLTAAGLLHSSRGINGGVNLAKPAKKISLLDIVMATEDRDLFTTCALGLAGCGEKCPCPLHQEWSKERKRIQAIFKKTTLDTLAGPIARGTLRLIN